jgi:CBS domain-containing protein
VAKKVRDVMTPRPFAVDYTQPIADAARGMRDLGTGVLFVVRDEILYGLVTDRDLVVRGTAESMGPDAAVGPLSSTDVVVVGADEDIAEAARLMRECAVRRLPVADNGQLAGLVSLGDLAVADDPRSALADISATAPNT